MRTRLFVRLALIAVLTAPLALVTAVGSSASAITGLDPRWGDNGVVALATPGLSSYARGAVQVGGRTYVGLETSSTSGGPTGAIVALDQQGQSVTTFADGGRLALSTVSPYGVFEQLVADRRGGLLVRSPAVGDQPAYVVRRVDLLSGALDAGFGDGGQLPLHAFGRAFAAGMTVDSLGRIYLTTWKQYDTYQGILRYTPDGRLDPTWGGGPESTPGRVNLSYVRGIGSLQADAQNRLIVTTANASSGGDQVFRLLPDGSIDPSFQGVYTTDSLSTVPSGDGIVAVTPLQGRCGVAVRRYDSSARLDPAFGDGGLVELETEPGGECFAYASDVVADSSGRPTVLMTVVWQGETTSTPVRLSLSGAIDSEVAPELDGARGARYFQMDVGSDDRLIFTGYEEHDGPAVGLVAVLLDDVGAAAGSRFVPLTPKRILDTRIGQGAPAARVGAGQSLRLPVAGAGTVPAAATAVVLNVTAVDPSQATYVTVHPAGTATPTASNLNLDRGATTPNLVTVKIGTGGAVQFFNAAGQVDLLADVAGYYVPASSALAADGFSPVQSRLYDSRPGTLPGATKGRLGPGGIVDLQVAGGSGSLVPADASAVVLNITGVQPTTSTLLRAYPTPASGAAVPLVSNVNLSAGAIAANLTVVAVGDGGRIRLRNDLGQTDVVVDLAGFYSRSTPGVFVPMSPTRFLDTRNGTGAPARRLGPGLSLDLQIDGDHGIPIGARAALANLTAVVPSSSTLLRMYSSDSVDVPLLSNLNVDAGQIRAGSVYFPLSTSGEVRLRNDAGSTDAVADVAGYFLE